MRLSRHRWARLGAVALALTVVATACGDDDDDDTTDDTGETTEAPTDDTGTDDTAEAALETRSG